MIKIYCDVCANEIEGREDTFRLTSLELSLFLPHKVKFVGNAFAGMNNPQICHDCMGSLEADNFKKKGDTALSIILNGRYDKRYSLYTRKGE